MHEIENDGTELGSKLLFNGQFGNVIHCPPLNLITLGRIKMDKINRMIHLTEKTVT